MAPRARSLAMPAAILVAVTTVVHVVALSATHHSAATLAETAGYALVAIGLLVVWRRRSRRLAGGVAALAVVTASIGEIPSPRPRSASRCATH